MNTNEFEIEFTKTKESFKVINTKDGVAPKDEQNKQDHDVLL